MAHLAGDGLLPDVDRTDGRRVDSRPLLFAIARDARTIFASWNIEWRSVFEKTMPVDRQVHLRLIHGDGVVETTVAVEPMSVMHYVPISSWADSYRLEIGYFRPFDTWNSVATSDEVEMPSHGSVEIADVDLATIPFHISFQQLANMFGTTRDNSIARVVSEFQKRALNGDKPNEAGRFDCQILNNLGLSLHKIAAAERNFKTLDRKRIARREHAMFRSAATSPTRAFQENLGS